QLHQRARADLLRGVLLVVDLDGPVGADMAFDRADRTVDVGYCLVLGGLAHQNLSVLRERDNRGRSARTLGVGDDDRLTTFENGDDRVRGPEVDSDRTSHLLFLLVFDCLCLYGLSAPIRRGPAGPAT